MDEILTELVKEKSMGVSFVRSYFRERRHTSLRALYRDIVVVYMLQNAVKNNRKKV